MALTHSGKSTIPESRRAWNRLPEDDDFDVHAAVRPERNLLSAVMCMVIHDLALCEGHQRRSAVQWVYSKSKKPFSLHWVCKHLDLDVDEMRRRLKAGEWASVPGETSRDYHQHKKVNYQPSRMAS